ncbi:MAG: transcription elongation factor GreB [Deltaproteobacteria bacterium]|jgi:transcription elongation factor GreB|nr:transcription elongation factor GreB [Deltaproteobacteria bacterium]
MGSYITPEGLKKLQEEAEHLWRVERPRVTHEVSEAAALGDRSENAEYIYGKKRLREIDRRLRFLGKRIDELTVVHPSPEQEGRVFFGAFVTLADEEGEHREYQLVGPDESDPGEGRLSIESPTGRALIGKLEGDEVLVTRPRDGEIRLEVVAIRYDWGGETDGQPT